MPSARRSPAARSQQQLTLVINAGGKSRRMGQPKALLPVPPHDRPLIAHVVQRLRVLEPQRVLIITNEKEVEERAGIARPVEFAPDCYPDVGPLGGLATALHICNDWVLMVACDMPLLNPELLRFLCSLAAEECGNRWDAVVPHVGGYLQPLHALYHRRCLPAVEAQLRSGRRKVTNFFPRVRVREVGEEEVRPLDPDLHSFRNVNTPEEWAQVLHLLHEL